jgi:6-phosphofructo-2-kinase / fructose-2,6-biphosphatase 2
MTKIIFLCRHGESKYNLSLSKNGQKKLFIFFDKYTSYSYLNEIYAGNMENLTYSELKNKYPLDYQNRKNNKFNYTYLNGESYKNLQKRVLPILDY